VIVAAHSPDGRVAFIHSADTFWAKPCAPPPRTATPPKVMGINIDRIISITFLIGGGLAGAAAILNGLYVNTACGSWASGWLAILYGRRAGWNRQRDRRDVGRLHDRHPDFIERRIARSGWTRAWVFSVLVLVLVFRPTGLLGESVGQKA